MRRRRFLAGAVPALAALAVPTVAAARKPRRPTGSKYGQAVYGTSKY